MLFRSIQLLKRSLPLAQIDVVVNAGSANILKNHPAISNIITYDKRGADSGFKGMRSLARSLKEQKYELAIVPHRSIRSALLVVLSGIPRRVGFDKSAGWFLFTDSVRYEKSMHEVERNISLLASIGIRQDSKEYPELFPSEEDKKTVAQFLSEHDLHSSQFIVVAPGTVWNTKRWPEEYFINLTKKITESDLAVALVGGISDTELCERIKNACASSKVINSAGKLNFLQSAELIRKSKLLVSNDSAPMHLAVAMRTPVVAVFGATIPGFGFAPYGKFDRVIETLGLDCRPCAIHGGDSCPVKTFYCMKNISAEKVFAAVSDVMSSTQEG